MPFRPQTPGGRGRFVFFPLVFGGGALALGGVVMALWNAILPEATHAGRLGYWQALGLLVLCRVLFGSWGGRGGVGGPGRRWGSWGQGPHARWQAMSEEERQQFRQRWQERGRGRGWPPAGPGSPAGPAGEAPAGR